MTWLILFAGALLVLWLQWRVKNRRLLQLARMLPGPTTVPGLGNAWMFMCNPEELVQVIKKMTLEYGDVMRFWLGPDLNVVVSDPDALKALLTSSKTSAKGQQYKYMAEILGGGILSGSGPTWRRHRKMASPNFGKRTVDAYSEIFNKEVALLLQEFRAISAGTQIDLYQSIVWTTSYAVCQTVMGLTREEAMKLPQMQDVIAGTPRCYAIIFDRMTKWWLQIDPVFWLSKHFRDQKKFVKAMNEFCEAIVGNRVKALKSMGKEKEDLVDVEEDSISNIQLSVVDRFILSNEMSNKELRQETFTIFTASQEATAKISSYLLLMLAYHPECQAKAYAEVVSVMGDRDRDITDEDLKKMPYLEMVFKEVIRLFPIGAILQRRMTDDFDLKSVTLPSGCSLVIPIYHMHRDPRYWDNPEAFDPERFNLENSKLRHPHCYMPFSLGPMDCLGRHFATKLVKTLCARVLRAFHLSSRDSYKDFRVCIAISVAAVSGFHAIIRPRKAL